MTLEFSLTLPDVLHAELLAAAADCQLTTRAFVVECVHSILAERRLPHVYVNPLSQGAQRRGPRGLARPQEVEEPEDVEEEEAEVVAALSPSDIPTVEDVTQILL